MSPAREPSPRDSHIYEQRPCRRWHACSAANEFAEDDASTSLQLATVTQVFCLLPPLNFIFVDTSPMNSPNGTHGDMKMNERHFP